MVRRKDYQGSVFVATRLVNGRDAEDALFAAKNAPLMVKIKIKSSASVHLSPQLKGQ